MVPAERLTFVVAFGCLLAATAIGNLGAQAVPAIPQLVAQLKNDTVKEARETAARALGRIGKAASEEKKGLIGPLRAATQADADPVTRVVAHGALAMIDVELAEQITSLRKYLHHDEALVRMKAAHALGMIGTVAKAAAPEIVEVLKLETDHHRRGDVARSLELTGDLASLPVLEAALAKETDPGTQGEMRGAINRLKALTTEKSKPADPPLVGYTELQTNLPQGRHANVRTMRAVVVRSDGTGRRLIGDQLANEPDSWTQFAGWSPDGNLAIIVRGWQSLENARWEEEHKSFRLAKDGWLVDSYLVDLTTGTATNLTSLERVSNYNSGLFFWPKDPGKLGFTALIDGNSHPFRMDRDGRNKVDLTQASKEFAYGFSSSRDGTRIAYHRSYQVFLADADGANARQVPTGQPFNFVPTWSPDGRWVLFLSGEHYNCHPHLVRADGTGLKKLADRGGYRGVIEFLDVFDFHGGSSDVPVWSADGESVFLTAKVGNNVELFQVTLDGRSTQVTQSPAGTLHYHPQPSPDGQRLLYGSKRAGVRQLFVRSLADGVEHRLTNLPTGRAAMWPHWQR